MKNKKRYTDYKEEAEQEVRKILNKYTNNEFEDEYERLVVELMEWAATTLFYDPWGNDGNKN